MPIPIIDSHIHLFPESHLPTLAWHRDPENPLGSQHCIDEYRTAAASTPIPPTPLSEPLDTTAHVLRGFIFIETDRISSIDPSQDKNAWNHVLDEVSLLTRIILGQPIPGEGHSDNDIDRSLCLGIIPWAPVVGGPELLAPYMALVKERTRTEEVRKKLCGVRYLVQDKGRGVMLQPGFIGGLKWLGKQRLVFDLGVDARQGGLWQLREAAEMMGRVYEDVEDERDRVVIVINHLCKPNLRLPCTSPESVTTHPDFLEWKASVTAMARYPTTYMKLSGGFSELPPLSLSAEPDISLLVERLCPWTDVIFDSFGPERVMFGSDWPVCNVGGGGNEVSWRRWKAVVDGVLEKRRLNGEQKRGVWGEVAVEAYGIKI